MDVLVLIDKLDDLVHNAKAVPLTDQVRLDREEIYEILDQMRATIPEEIKQARWIVKERQEMLAEAKRECDRIIQEAREQALREASQTEIVKLAERQADGIVDDARRQARETRLEMEDWADSILSTLEVNLDKFLGAVKRGRERLHERSQETVVAGIGPEPIEQEELREAVTLRRRRARRRARCTRRARASTNASAAGLRCRSRCQTSAITRGGTRPWRSITATLGSATSTVRSGATLTPTPAPTSPWTVPLLSERKTTFRARPSRRAGTPPRRSRAVVEADQRLERDLLERRRALERPRAGNPPGRRGRRDRS